MEKKKKFSIIMIQSDGAVALRMEDFQMEYLWENGLAK